MFYYLSARTIGTGLLLAMLSMQPAGADDSIELIGSFSISGKQIDKSGLAEQLEPGLPHNLFGGISAIEYLGHDDLYLALPDRGPRDGAIDWDCRVQVVRLPLGQFEPPTTAPGEGFSVVRTVMLKDGSRRFAGLASRFEETASEAARLDPEGIRLGQNGNFFLSDEYGPHLLEFTADGNLQRRFNLPQRYKVKTPCVTKEEENSRNESGRQGNQGLEGLAVSPDLNQLFALFQGPLLQDCARPKSGKPKGMNCRLMALDAKQESLREFLYPLDEPGNKLNELMWFGDNSFLVIERDGEAGTAARFKKIMRIDVANASEIQDRDRLPADSIPEGVRPVGKETFIDLLDERFGLAGAAMPEKIEGLTFGPNLADGRRTLLVASDNDFIVALPTLVYCFAIGQAADAAAQSTSAESVVRQIGQ